MNKLLIITGPTATGKTALGLQISQKCSGEIISADSRQVYKYMDIGTGKDVGGAKFTKEEIFSFNKGTVGYYLVEGVRIWGLDIVEPGQDFSASDWVNYTREIISYLWKQGKLPIIVGGTGQYIKELLFPSPTLHLPPSESLRSANYSLRELQEMIQSLDPERWRAMNNSDRNNPRRLVRAVEVAKYGFKLRSGDNSVPIQEQMDADILIIGLWGPRKLLNERIDQRVEQRLLAGMEREREFLKQYTLPKTLGYNGETAEEWKLAEHRYAKRQIAYLRKFLPQTVWFDISVYDWQDKVWLKVQNWLAI